MQPLENYWGLGKINESEVAAHIGYRIAFAQITRISWFKRQSLTFMILKYRFNSFRDAVFMWGNS